MDSGNAPDSILLLFFFLLMVAFLHPIKGLLQIFPESWLQTTSTVKMF
jgi:hypothetical protein